MIFRPACSGDLEEIVALRPDGWLDYSEYIRFYLKMEENCSPFVGVQDGKIIGTGTCNINENVGWLSHIIVNAGHRNKGYGQVITKLLIDNLERKKCKSIMLLATSFGEPVYRKLGFHPVMKYKLFKGELIQDKNFNNCRKLVKEDLPEVLDIDKKACGENRDYLIKSFFTDGWVYVDKDNKLRGYYLRNLWDGPVVALDREAGRQLLKVRCTEKNAIFIPEENSDAIREIQSNGFIEQEFHVKRMYFGENLEWNPSMIYGRIAGAFG